MLAATAVSTLYLIGLDICHLRLHNLRGLGVRKYAPVSRTMPGVGGDLITAINTGSDALCGGADGPRRRSDGPRPGTEARVSVSRAGRSARAQRQRSSPYSTWISLPGETPSGRSDLRVCLGIGRPPKTPLNNVEPENYED